MALSIFDVVAALFGLVALFGYINHKVLKLPHSIGLMVIALAAALVLIAIEFVFPASDVHGPVTAALATIDFDKTLLNGMLSFLLFAGALHVDLPALRSQLMAITAMSTLGVVLSTFTVGTLAWLGFGWLGLDMPFIWALAFGALISPTDPVAVLGILKTIKVPAAVEAKIAGESLFNSMLFLLIGLEVLVVQVDLISAEAALLAIPIVLLARFIGVSIPLTLLSLRQSFTKGAVPVLVWGGLRGGISVALALALPEGPQKAPILAITYAVVVFSIVVQGLTFKTVVSRALKPEA